jgi:hypothetical protein
MESLQGLFESMPISEKIDIFPLGPSHGFLPLGDPTVLIEQEGIRVIERRPSVMRDHTRSQFASTVDVV